jgi:formylglycine-generating enzyme required for sulfatase activity
MTNNNNIFEMFEGQDLKRFFECIKACTDAGLKPSKNTQYGLNHNSGNVWLWDEDWLGAVACSVNCDVAWYWSCPECGEEYSFTTYAALQNFAEANSDGHCPRCISALIACRD